MPLSTFLRDRPFTHLRGALLLALDDTAIVLAGSATSDAGGGATSVWSARGTVPCRVAPLTHRPTDRTTAGQIDERSTHVCMIPPDAIAMDPGFRVVVVGRGTFEVTGVRDRTGALADVFEVLQIS